MGCRAGSVWLCSTWETPPPQPIVSTGSETDHVLGKSGLEYCSFDGEGDGLPETSAFFFFGAFLIPCS